jgi:hypothetical protein
LRQRRNWLLRRRYRNITSHSISEIKFNQRVNSSRTGSPRYSCLCVSSVPEIRLAILYEHVKSRGRTKEHRQPRLSTWLRTCGGSSELIRDIDGGPLTSGNADDFMCLTAARTLRTKGPAIDPLVQEKAAMCKQVILFSNMAQKRHFS